ncbi:uncharacterized protein LOC144112008 [Amblyomma americanum]
MRLPNLPPKEPTAEAALVTGMVDAKSGSRYTFGELLDTCRRVAAGLRRLGLQPGNVVAFKAATSSELLVAMCGTLFAGGITALIKVIIGITGASGGATSLSQLKQSPLDDCESRNLCPDSVLAIIYSSGTTGSPKGVQLTHRNVIAQVVMYGLLGPSVFDKDDIVICTAPVMHIAGFWVVFGNLGHGCKLILLHTLDIGLILEAIDRHKPTMLTLYPTFLAKFEEHPLLEHVDTTSVTKLMTGGSLVSSSVLKKITLKLGLKGVIQVYGMTELGSCIAYSTPEMDDFRSAGKPGPFVEIKVVEENTRKALGPYQHGEICVKSPGAFKSYLNNPKATAETYENGFVRTGDLGYYTPDGRFYVCSRLKDLIKCMDQQVAPAELEELLSSDPEVRQVVVVGVPHPEYGEAARAFVVPRRLLQPGSHEEQREAQRLRDLVAGRLAAHKHLYAGVEFLEDIPRTANGKNLRSSLKEAYVQLHCKCVKK